MRPKQFVFFLRLPPELRRIIWWFSIPGPRTVTIFSQKEAYVTNEDGHAACNPSISAKSNSKPSALLHATRESREIALKSYSLSFKEHLNQRPVYFRFSTDTLYMENWHAFRCFFGRKKSYTQAKLLELQHLRKNLRILVLGYKHFNTGWAEFMYRMVALETLVFSDELFGNQNGTLQAAKDLIEAQYAMRRGRDGLRLKVMLLPPKDMAYFVKRTTVCTASLLSKDLSSNWIQTGYFESDRERSRVNALVTEPVRRSERLRKLRG
jgi:hypothetical protein